MRLKIAGGRLFDPARDWHGEVGDLYLEDGVIVPPLGRVERVIAAAGQMVCAGGIDLRGMAATYGLNFLRCRRGLPSLKEVGAAYASLGYTHVHEPFLTLTTANYVHRQLAALPLVDTSASLVLNLRDLDLWLGDAARFGELQETIRFLLEQTRSLNLRLAEPFVRYRQDFYAHRTIKTERTLEIVADWAKSQDLTITVEAGPEVLRAALPEPGRFHLAGLGPALVADDLLPAAISHLERGATGDLGLMLPGPVGGPPAKIDLGWFQPLDLNPGPDAAARRRALSLALRYHGQGLAFSAAGPLAVADYPRLWSWLFEPAARRQDWGEALGPRRYSLSQWVWATRTLPARILGLTDRGRLSPGSRGDVALYDLPPDAPPDQWPRFLGRCRTLLKAGEIVVHDYQMVNPDVGRATYYRRTGAAATDILRETCQFRSWRWENLWSQEELGGPWVAL